MPFLELWRELRKRLIFCLFMLAVFAVLLLPFANHLFTSFSRPINRILDPSQHLIATGILSGFWVPIELSLWFALLLTMPILLWQLWCFIRPALKDKEKYWGKIYLWGSLGFFCFGLSFAYFVVLPICLHVLLKATPPSVSILPDIVNYLNFSFRLLLSFGLACQLPLLTLLVCQLGLTTPEKLKSYRRYVIVAAFVVGMIIAPDVISQCFLAIPLWILFELGVLLSAVLL